MSLLTEDFLDNVNDTTLKGSLEYVDLKDIPAVIQAWYDTLRNILIDDANSYNDKFKYEIISQYVNNMMLHYCMCKYYLYYNNLYNIYHEPVQYDIQHESSDQFVTDKHEWNTYDEQLLVKNALKDKKTQIIDHSCVILRDGEFNFHNSPNVNNTRQKRAAQLQLILEDFSYNMIYEKGIDIDMDCFNNIIKLMFGINMCTIHSLESGDYRRPYIVEYITTDENGHVMPDENGGVQKIIAYTKSNYEFFIELIEDVNYSVAEDNRASCLKSSL